MSLLGFKARNHPQQVSLWSADDGVDDRATTPEVFGPLMDEFGFTIDVAASEHNAKCERFYDRGANGLAQSWAGERVWCNPPYSNIGPWVSKANAETDAEVIVMLLPANRTEQRWWQDHVEPFRDRPGSRISTRFIAGRLRFLAPGEATVKPNSRPPFGCVLLIWGAP
jgi:phage N-6-adenine-methyltransferase